jgi:hypothetical protein
MDGALMSFLDRVYKNWKYLKGLSYMLTRENYSGSILINWHEGSVSHKFKREVGDDMKLYVNEGIDV